MSWRLSRILCVAACVAAIVAWILPGAAEAAVTPRTAWRIDQSAIPTRLETESSAGPGEAPAATPRLRLIAVNIGGVVAEETRITDVLPSGLKADPESQPIWREKNPSYPENNEGVSTVKGPCTVSGAVVTCELDHRVLPAEKVAVYIGLDVTASEEGIVQNQLTVEDASGSKVERQVPTEIGKGSAGFSFPPASMESVGGAATDPAGNAARAGEHPFLVELTAKVSTKELGAGTPLLEARPSQALRSLGLSLPRGLVINPQATATKCKKADFEVGEGTCPAESQVGLVTTEVLGGLEGTTFGLYNLESEPGVPAELGFSLTGTGVTIRGGLSGDFALTAESSEILSRYAIDGVKVQLWGVPSDHQHDAQRISDLGPQQSRTCENGCEIRPSPAAFVTMPSSCSPDLQMTAYAHSWSGSAIERSEVFRMPAGQVEPVEGCDQLSFHPSVDLTSTSDATSSPTGLDFSLQVPQGEALGGLAAATVKRVSVHLPDGMAVNSAAANGLAACSESQIGLGDTSPATCPNASRVGTAEVVSPLLSEVLIGNIYLAEQTRNPFGNLLALYLAVQGDGVVIKLSGRVDADPQTGQLTASFDNNPQLPFSKLSVHFNSGPRATLVTPSACGTYLAQTEIESWASSTPVTINSPLVMDQACSDGGFSPKLEAGTTNPAAGRYSPFSLRVTRQDGEQNLYQVSSTLPPGLLAKLAGVPLCPDVEAVSGDCPGSSQVGSTITGVGAGPLPLYIPQAGRSPTAIYLAGPYKGAPYSLVVKVPAQAGPFDLGQIAVRVALNVDPYTAQVTATSDPLPQILEGIPVAYRDLRVEVDRPGFVRNPTSCQPMRVVADLVSGAGATATPASRFQVAGCSSLMFKPSLKLTLEGSTTRTGHPGLKAVLTYPKKGEFADIARAQVSLPHSEFLDQGNIAQACTKVLLAARTCSAKSIYGRVKAWTPLLEKPLEGPVYLVGGYGYKLPALVAELDGQIRVLLVGKVDTSNSHGIRNTFEAVPDAPVDRFVLELKGGKRYGLLENSENLCKKPQKAGVAFRAQNGTTLALSPAIANSCENQKSQKRRKHTKKGGTK